MFAQNLTSLRKSQAASQGQVAQALGLNRSTYACYETGKSEPNASTLLKMADYFRVSTEVLLRGAVEMPPLFRQSVQTLPPLLEEPRILAITVTEAQRENIQYVPVAAVAGYASEYNQPEFIEQLPHFSLPKLRPGTYRAFDVQGDSMPPIQEGYVIIGRYVERADDLQDGGRYILVIREGGVVFKQITRDARRPARLILTADNPTFSPYTVELADVLEAWELAAFVGFGSVYQNNFHLLLERLHVMEQKIDRLTPVV